MARPIKQYTKRKYTTDYGPLIKEGTMTRTKRNTKEVKSQQDFLSALGPEALRLTPNNTIQIPNRTGQN